GAPSPRSRRASGEAEPRASRSCERLPVELAGESRKTRCGTPGSLHQTRGVATRRGRCRGRLGRGPLRAAPPAPPVPPERLRRPPARGGGGLPDGGDFIFEPKGDGFRVLVFRDGDELLLQSRDAKPLDRYFPELRNPLRRQLPPRCVLDGELVIATPAGLDFE